MKKSLSLVGACAAVLLLILANKAPAQEINEANPAASYYSGSYYNPYPVGNIDGGVYRPYAGWYGRSGYGWYGTRYRAGYWGGRYGVGYRGGYGYGGRYAYGYRGYRVGGFRRY